MAAATHGIQLHDYQTATGGMQLTARREQTLQPLPAFTPALSSTHTSATLLHLLLANVCLFVTQLLLPRAKEVLAHGRVIGWHVQVLERRAAAQRTDEALASDAPDMRRTFRQQWRSC